MHHSNTHGFAVPGRVAHELGLVHGMRVADVGAGSGHYTFALAEAVGKHGVVYAVDVQKDLLTRLKNEAHQKHISHIEIVWGDIETAHGTKIADHTLDLVLASNILFQLPDKRALFEEAYRILKPSGRLALIDWKESYNHMGPHPDHVVSADRALEIAQECGFAALRTFDPGAHHWGLLLRIVPHDAIL